MIKKNKDQKSYLFVVILIIIYFIIPTISLLCFQIRVNGTSIWIQDSEIDFEKGTMNNLILTAEEKNAVLKLNYTEINEWINVTPEINPISRSHFALSTIYGTDKILLFGGYGHGAPILNDTWIYDLSENKWIKKNIINVPTARMDYAMSSVWGTDKVILMGGTTGTSSLFDTWIYDLSNNSWTNITTINNPKKIQQHSMASIWGTSKIVLFGGAKSGIHNETWIYNFDNNSWTFKEPTSSPSKRVAHGMTTIYGTDKVLMFGGIYGGYGMNDTWVYDLSENNWTQLQNRQKGMFQHGIASIYGTDKIVHFGGVEDIATLKNDTWIFDYSENSWMKIIQTNNPQIRYGHEMASIWGTDKVVLFSGADGVSFNDTWVFDPFKYIDNGTFTSSPYDIGQNSSFKTISWEANGTINTSIKLKLRTAETKVDLNSKDFIGPDGSSVSYYFFSPTDIWSGHNGDRWIQYKAYLNTINSEETPTLRNITITYNHWPNTTLISPSNGDIINNKPIFWWNFTDSDSTHQTAFQVLVDDIVEFQSVDYNSGKQNSSSLTWQFPNRTNYNEIADGIWYWKVRTKDNDGDWSVYSQPWMVKIDTNAPNSIINIPVNEFYNNLNMIYGIASDSLNGTGLNKIEITINRLIDNSYWTGQKWIDSEIWLITSGTTNWSYDSSSVIWNSDFKYNIQSRAIDKASNIEIPMMGKNFTMDFDNVTFSNFFPSYDEETITENVKVGIMISDQTSGINASTIEYKLSEDEGETWSSWKPVIDLNNGMNINITLNLTLPNGTGNRIKWRAKDLAGNGPTESKAYSVNVNTWLQTLIPRVKLWSPPNGSVVPTTSVKLNWLLENVNLLDVTYDLYFDTIPPSKLNISDLTETNFKIDNLINGETYYWTIIPRIDSEEGICTSGIWSFTIDSSVVYPTVKLLRPKNGSIVSSTKPTLAWSVDYYGTETLSYDVYLDSRPELISYEVSFNRYYLPSTLLHDNQTYYWKVVPKAGNVVGPESETWSFTIRKDYVPHFELELKVEPDGIVMEPGSIKMVKAFVTNKGELTDRISLSIEIPFDSDMGGMVNEPNIQEAEPGETANFSFILTTTQNIEPGEVIITVTATSGEALDFGIHYEEELKVKVIIFVEKEAKPEKTSEWLFFWSILIIVIVIILALLILILFRRKKQEKEVIPDDKTGTSKSLETPTTEKAQEALLEAEKEIKEPVETSIRESVPGETQAPEPQLPAKPKFDTSSQLTPSTTPKPTLVASPTVAQTPIQKQIPETQKMPQLPPAGSQLSKKGEG